MAKFIPTTNEIRQAATEARLVSPEAFDRWLAERDAEKWRQTLLDAADRMDAELSASQGYWLRALAEKGADRG